jgi:hypothetical protein
MPEQEIQPGILVSIERYGTAVATDVQVLGDVRPTEVADILALAIKNFREKVGIPTVSG